MKFSNFFIPTIKESPSDVKMRSHDLMIRSGMIRQEASGIYSWLPLGFRVLKKIISIIENEHDNAGINQILMPTIQGSEIWKISDRYETYGQEMLRIVDRNDKELLYGPTNEEMITSIGKQYIKSYKNLPRRLYHIQSKFRDEIRPRFGVMRAREFIMKDAYSFDINEKDGETSYLYFFKLYLSIFQKLEIPILPVRAPSGEIGGNLSHEFHLLVNSGESDICIMKNVIESNLVDLNLEQILNLQSYTLDFYKENQYTEKLNDYKSIELGHIFLFGTKYSSAFNFEVDSVEGKFYPFMGSYGLGISRMPAAVIELSNDKDGIIWPKALAPFSIQIINLMSNDNNCIQFCEKLYSELIDKKMDVLYDDRNESPGKKFSDADLIGIPVQIICGNSYKKSNQLSIIVRKTKKEINVDSNKIVNFLMDMIT